MAARWREAGVAALLHACVEPSEIPAIRALADRFPEMRYSVGVHPLDTKHWQDDTVSVLRRAALEDDRVIAIGELGLGVCRPAVIPRSRSTAWWRCLRGHVGEQEECDQLPKHRA